MRYTIADVQRYTRRFYGNNALLVTPFGYPVFFAPVSGVTVPSGGEATQTINIQANADFLLTGVSYNTIGLAATSVGQKPAAILTLDIRESGSKEPFTDSPIYLENYAGNGVQGRELDYLRFLAGGTTVEFVLGNLGAFEDRAFENGIEIFLSGQMVRVFSR